MAVTDPELVREGLLKLSNIKEVIAAGDTKVSLTFAFEYEISADFRLVTEEQFPTTLHHFTGSKDHNIKMRQLAKEKAKESVNTASKPLKLEKLKLSQAKRVFRPFRASVYSARTAGDRKRSRGLQR